jgi:hypothetical protein
MSRKYSKLFWCGLFITLFGGYLLVTSVLSFVTIFSLPASFFTSYSASPIFTLMIFRAVIFTVLYALLLAVGVYVLKKGIINEQSPPPILPLEQPTSEPSP